MAKIKFGGLATDARGKLDGVVYARNQYGAYIRKKVSPVQPNTARQGLVRGRLQTLASRYSQVITDDQRTAWINFAPFHPVTDVFGQAQQLTGISMYVRLNAAIMNVGGAIIDDPPVDLSVTELLSVTPTVTAAPLVSIAFTVTPLGADERLIVWATESVPTGIRFLKNRLRFIAASAAAQASPFAITAPYGAKFGPPVSGRAVGLLVQVIDETKGLPTPGIFSYNVVP